MGLPVGYGHLQQGICHRDAYPISGVRYRFGGGRGIGGGEGQFRDSCLQWGLQIRADYFMNWLQMTG